jgi:hypothetical protein
MPELLNCDKCGGQVERSNNACVIHDLVFGTDFSEILPQHRHLIPIPEICEGSPSRAQYIEGQPRDARGYPYLEEYEESYRAAYRSMQNP